MGGQGGVVALTGRGGGAGTDLVHEHFGTRVQPGCDGVVKRVLEALFLTHDAVQEVCAVDVRSLLCGGVSGA